MSSESVNFKSDQLHFEKAAPKHQEIIFNWLAEPHMFEFWDNSEEHKQVLLKGSNPLSWLKNIRRLTGVSSLIHRSEKLDQFYSFCSR